MRKSKNSGLSIAATAPVSLKVLSWNVAGLAEDLKDIFLSQISMLAEWDVLRVIVARMFPKTGWGGCWCARIVHTVRTLGRFAMSGSYRQSEMERTIEDCRECGKMDRGRAGWTVDLHLSTLASQRKQTGRIRGYIDGTPRVLEWEAQTACDLGWRLQLNLFGMTDCFHVGESIPRPRTLIDTNDSLRARALHSMVTELDLTERELFTRSSWSNAEDSLTQMDFIKTSRKVKMKHEQVLDSAWFKTDHRAVFAVLSLKQKIRHTVRVL